MPRSFTAISATHWWLLGSVACGSRDCPTIMTTTDGGVTFRSLPAPGGSFGPSLRSGPAAAGIRFADAEDGWVFGPALYATHDGGHHWASIPVPGQVLDLEPGQGEVFAVVAPTSPACARSGTCASGAPAPRLWRAPPGSDDWSPDRAAGDVSGGLAVHGDSVWVIDSMATADGWALGTGLVHSTDGGDHFALEPEEITGVACSYSPASDTVVWAYCSGGHFMFSYVSTDTGAQFAPVGPSGSPPTPNNYPNGSTLQAASPTTAVAVNDLPGSALIRTVDSGATWRTVALPPNQSGTWSIIGFTTPGVGYAFWEPGPATGLRGTTRLWRTTDGGATWAPVMALS